MTEVWNERRAETVDELLRFDSVGHMEGADACGPEEFKVARAKILAAIPDLQLTVEGTLAETSHVVVRWRATGTHTGDQLGIPATFQRVDFRGLSWLTFEGRKLVEGWDSWNQGALLARLRAAAERVRPTREPNISPWAGVTHHADDERRLPRSGAGAGQPRSTRHD
jgi:predicted ester cyclase